MILVQPKQRVGKKECAHLVSPVVKDERVPVLVFALAWVGVFVKVRAVEKRQPMPVFGKVRRYPIHDHAQSGLVCGIDEVPEIIRSSIP